MYEFVTHTKNYIKGKCLHDCSYCYVKKFKLNPIRLDEKEFEEDLGENNFIFVGSSCDMFADDVPEEWILKTLAHCKKHDKNKYLFQSKNPKRIYQLREQLPDFCVIGTTIETNRFMPDIMGKSPQLEERSISMDLLSKEFETTVTIEPIMDFDVEELVSLIKECNPAWVNIGADSKGHNLPEPSKDKILKLVEEIEKFTKIEKKRNLKRILETD